MKFENLSAKTIKFKLVEESDAEFICELRANPELNKHISQSSADIQAQRDWIRNYKMRETNNEEYYFIICRNDNNQRVGTIRLYDFKDNPKSFCWGSWILNENKTRYAAIESALLVYPEIKKQFFLKWTEEQLLLEIDQVLAYFVAERVVQIQAHNIHINDADDFLRFLSSFSHLYELNLTKE